jgi:hypothetical protein
VQKGTISASANKIIATTCYHSKNISWTLDKVVTRHNEKFDKSALERNDTQKVITFLDCITDTLLFPMKLSIRANNQLRDDYAGTVSYLMEQITLMGNESNANRQIGVSSYSIPRKTIQRAPGMTGCGYGRGCSGRVGRILNHAPALESWDPTKPGAYYRSMLMSSSQRHSVKYPMEPPS